MRWRNPFLAALVAVSSTATGLAMTASPVDAEGEFEQPAFPEQDLQVLDTPAYASWLMVDNGTVRYQNQTHVGAMYDEAGPSNAAAVLEPTQGIDPARAIASNQLPAATVGSSVGAGRPKLTAVGDLDAIPSDASRTRSPDLVTVDAQNVLRVTRSLDEGLPLRSQIDLDLFLPDYGGGSPVAVGILDGFADPAANAVWVVVDTGRTLLLRASSPGQLTVVDDHQLPVWRDTNPVLDAVNDELVRDAASFSVLDQDLRGPAVSRPGRIAILTTAPFGTNGSGHSAHVHEIEVGADGAFLEGEADVLEGDLPWAGGPAELAVDVVDLDRDPGTADASVSYAALATNAGDVRQAVLVTDGFIGPFCRSNSLHRTPQLDLERRLEGRIITCATDAGIMNDGRRHVRVDHLISAISSDVFGDPIWSHREESVTQPVQASTNSVGIVQIEEVMLDIPCDWLLAAAVRDPGASKECSSGGFSPGPFNTAELEHTYKWPPRITTIVHLRDHNGANRIEVISRDPVEDPLPRVIGPNLSVEYLPHQYGYGFPLGTTEPISIVPLPRITNRLTVRLDDHTTPTIVNAAPRPIAVLVAPPYVAGAGQVPLAGPTYNSRESTGTGSGSTTSNSVGFSLGVNFSDPTGMHGLSASASIEHEVTTETETSLEITGAEQYVGSPTEDTIVYDTVTMWRFPGMVVESSTGVGIGDRTQIDIPRSNLITSATLSELQRQFPAEFTGGTNGKGILSDVLPHTPGDPGSYVEWGDVGLSGAVQTYCDNASYESPPDDAIDVGYPWGVSDSNNPFLVTDLDEPDLSGPGILTSDPHRVGVNQGTSEGAGVSITNSTTQSQISTTTFGAEVGAQLFYATIGASASHTWGESWSTSFSSGVDFLGYVGHLPTNLEEEQYDWRAFLCKKRMGPLGGSTAGGMPVWVFGYTVDDYEGSGGLEALAPLALAAPRRSQIVDGRAALTSLSWTQETGTVKSYDVELEAIGTEDHRFVEDLFEITSTVQAKARSTDLDKTLLELGINEDLRQNQLYRWRVTARDLFDNEVTSDWEFFETAGPPEEVTLQLSDSTPVAGQELTITAEHEDVGGPFTYSYDLGDGQVVAAGANPQTIMWPNAGVYTLHVGVTNAYGELVTSLTVPVGPNAVDEEAYDAVEDTTLTVSTEDGVMANDTGGDFVRVATAPQHGTVALDLDGSFTYRPEPDFCGEDSFTYAVRGGPGVAHATAPITVACVNDAPTAVDSDFDTGEDTDLQVAAPGVLAGAEDVDGDELDALQQSSPSHGSLTLQENGSFTYEPDQDFCGSDSFEFRASDGELTSGTVAVTIRTVCVNDPPETADLDYEATEDTARTVDLEDGLARGASDVDDEDRTFAVVQQPPRGTVELDDGGAFTYTPNADLCGEDTFTYTATDPHGAVSDPGTVTLAVGCVNDAPVATATSYEATEDTDLDVDAAGGLLAGATDVDGDGLTAAIEGDPSHGELTLAEGGDGGFVYAPALDYCGSDDFTFTVADGNGGTSEPVTGSISISCVNDAPSPGADVYDAVDGEVLHIPAPGVLANDSDVDGDPVSVIARTGHTIGGPVEFFADGSMTFTPRPGFHGAATQTYGATDPHGASTAGHVTFDVKARTTLTATRATRAGGQATVSATLQATGDGAPAAGATVRFFLSDGRLFCTATTGADGVATCSAPVPTLFLGLFGRYQADFAGNDEYLPSISPSTPFGSLTQ